MSDYQLALILFHLYLAFLNKDKPVFIGIMTALWGLNSALLYFK
jgi:hypothetical protein